MTADALRTFFRIRPGETGKVVRFSIVAGLLQAGIALGVSSADSLFLTQVGADMLPRIYVIMPFIMLAFVPVSNFFLSKFGRAGMLRYSLVFLAVTGVLLTGGLVFLQSRPEGWARILHYAYYFVKLFAELWAIVFFTLLWNYIDAYFDIQDAKRLFAFFSGGMALGAMLGGGLVTLLVMVMPVSWLFAVWGLLCAATVPVVAGTSARWPVLDEGDAGEEDAHGSGGALKSLLGSPYAVALTLVILAILMLTTLCEYQCMNIFEEGRSAAQIASLFGLLIVGVNVFNLIINFFFFNRLVFRFGVRNLALIQPVVYALSFSYFLLRYGFGPAVFGYFAYQGILQSVEFNNQNFLFNALPARSKAAIRTFIEGLCEPLATAVVGGLLMAAAAQVLPETLSLSGLAGAVVLFCLVLWMRTEYGTAMIENLKSSWMDFSVTGRSLAALSATDEEIVRKISYAEQNEKAVAAIGLYWMFNRPQALEALLAYLERTVPGDQDAAAPLVVTILKDGDGATVQRLLVWLRTTRHAISPLVRQELLRSRVIGPDDLPPATGAATAEDRATSSVALWNSWRLEANLEGVDIMNRLMHGTHEERIAAIRSLGRLERPRYIRLLAGFLRDDSAAVRKQTLLALYELVDGSSDELLGEFIQVVRRGDHEDRAIALNALERMRNAAALRPLVVNGHRFTPFEKRKTEHLAGVIGLKSIPILVDLLQDPAIRYEGRALAARILSRLAFPQLNALADDLLHAEIERAYRFLCARQLLEREPGRELAAAICGETADKVVRFVLEVLTLSGQLPDFELIAASLRSSSPKDRANAVETIEQACSRSVSHALLPLLDERPLDVKCAFFRTDLGRDIPGRYQVLEEMVQSAYDLTVAAAVATVFDGGMSPEEDREIRDVIQGRLLTAGSGLVSSVLMSLLERKYAAGTAAEPNAVEKAAQLIASDFLPRFPILELEDVIHASRSVHVTDGDCVFADGSTPDTVYIVTKGTVEAAGDDGSRTVEPGTTLGTEILYSRHGYRNTVRSNGADLLCLPRQVIMDTAAIHPIFAIELMAGKFHIPKEGDE